MNSTIRTRIARSVVIAIAASISAVTTTSVAQPAPVPEPDSERPCFIVQPRWNDAFDGPAPTCPTPTWQQPIDEEHSSTAWTKPRVGFDDTMP